MKLYKGKIIKYALIILLAVYPRNLLDPDSPIKYDTFPDSLQSHRSKKTMRISNNEYFYHYTHRNRVQNICIYFKDCYKISKDPLVMYHEICHFSDNPRVHQ